VQALAHITGGGLLENIPRVLPQGLRAELDAGQWALPPLFGWLQERGRMEAAELARTFNCGLGMVLVVSPDRVGEVTGTLTDAGETVYRVGAVKVGQRGVTIRAATPLWGQDTAWTASHDQ